jgi:hypothetical protein
MKCRYSFFIKFKDQFEFNIHEGPDLKDVGQVVPKYEINPLINNKVIASYRKT